MFKLISVSTDWVVIADMNDVKLRSLGNTDESIYSLAGGDSFSNVVAVVHDKANGMVYFSDVNRYTTTYVILSVYIIITILHGFPTKYNKCSLYH